MLVAGGASLIRAGQDPEGFSAGARQFDSDITVGRYPRAALGLGEGELIAVVCEGRADDEAGLRWPSWRRRWSGSAPARRSTSTAAARPRWSSAARLLNTPREEHGLELVGGREIATALQFFAR